MTKHRFSNPIIENDALATCPKGDSSTASRSKPIRSVASVIVGDTNSAKLDYSPPSHTIKHLDVIRNQST
eukprot:snap_masked-scaffold_11-processed-gene-3.21-mRNA-1 protein AED:1.00 eAED:1.00 QI:0/-1/0/0/-1/1/1/0/69